MDSAQDSLASLGQLLQKIENGPGGLRVETRSGLVDEKQQRGLGSEFDTDGKTLSLLNVESFTGNADDGIGIFLHVQQLDNLLDVRELLLLGDVGGLTENGAEVESLSDGGRLQVEILLLNVTGLALEGHVSGMTIDQHFTGNNTH